jgi:hypothetical protein
MRRVAPPRKLLSSCNLGGIRVADRKEEGKDRRRGKWRAKNRCEQRRKLERRKDEGGEGEGRRKKEDNEYPVFKEIASLSNSVLAKKSKSSSNKLPKCGDSGVPKIPESAVNFRAPRAMAYDFVAAVVVGDSVFP